MTTINSENYPMLCRALRTIEEDHGGHLIGTVYPGQKIDLDSFTIPEAWEHLIPGAERALVHLMSGSAKLFDDFVAGEQSDQETILANYPALSEAHILIGDWFNGFQDEDKPFRKEQPR